jgi:hypothetical protein
MISLKHVKYLSKITNRDILSKVEKEIIMLNLLKVSLVTVGIISNVFGSASTDPLTTGNEPISQSGQKEEAWNTQAFLEQMLREEGALLPGKHLAPHEVWRLADFLKARINARRVLQAH